MLAKHRAPIEANVQRAEQSGQELTIRGALRLIAGSRPAKPPRPKSFSEITAPVALSQFLEQHQQLVFEALTHAPTLKAEIIKRLERRRATVPGGALLRSVSA